MMGGTTVGFFGFAAIGHLSGQKEYAIHTHLFPMTALAISRLLRGEFQMEEIKVYDRFLLYLRFLCLRFRQPGTPGRRGPHERVARVASDRQPGRLCHHLGRRDEEALDHVRHPRDHGRGLGALGAGARRRALDRAQSGHHSSWPVSLSCASQPSKSADAEKVAVEASGEKQKSSTLLETVHEKVASVHVACWLPEALQGALCLCINQNYFNMLLGAARLPIPHEQKCTRSPHLPLCMRHEHHHSARRAPAPDRPRRCAQTRHRRREEREHVKGVSQTGRPWRRPAPTPSRYSCRRRRRSSR